MTKAHSRGGRAIPEPPSLDIINFTLDPNGEIVTMGIEKMFSPEQILRSRTTFIAKHRIAGLIEGLMAVLDQLDGDTDLELNVANNLGDPRLDDCEGVLVPAQGGSFDVDDDVEPMLGSGEEVDQSSWGRDDRDYFSVDCEQDDAEVSHHG